MGKRAKTPDPLEAGIRFGTAPQVRRDATSGSDVGWTSLALLQFSPTQEIPSHAHTQTQDTFYVLEGEIRLILGNPDEELRLRSGEISAVPPGRPHRVTNGGDRSATFLVLQHGDYDYVPHS
jgi:quercetin dioxygenase-like cupin family protein